MNVGDLCHFDRVAVENLLRTGILNATRQASPSTRSINSVGDTFSFGSKSNDLLEDSFTFLVNCSAGLENYRSEIIVGFLKSTGVSVNLLTSVSRR